MIDVQIDLRLRAASLPIAALFLGLMAMVTSPKVLQAQALNGIADPESGAEVGGIVVVTGTAVDADFLRFEVAFRPAAGGDWIVFAQGDQPVTNGTLAVWDTTVGQETVPVFPDGRYQLRLRVVRQDYNYDEYFVSDLVVANESLTPTPETSPTAELAGAGSASEGSATPNGSVPAVLPTLTPFPTPSPAATIASVPLGPGQTGGQNAGSGLAQQIGALELGRLVGAFWIGVAIAMAAFAGLGVYIVLRAVVRRLRFRWRRRRAS